MPEPSRPPFGTSSTREEYEALIPDPALGIFWGHPFDGHQRRPQNTTPDGIRQNFDLDHAPLEMLHALADKMLDGVTGTGDFGEWNLYRTGYGVKRASTQWEWVHPEMPLARMIIEAEFWTEEWKPRRESGQSRLNEIFRNVLMSEDILRVAEAGGHGATTQGNYSRSFR